MNIELWIYRPQFGMKTVVWPSIPEQLSYPTYLGPNETAQVRGVVRTPATVDGKPVSGVRISLMHREVSSTLNIGVAPYRRS